MSDCNHCISVYTEKLIKALDFQMTNMVRGAQNALERVRVRIPFAALWKLQGHFPSVHDTPVHSAA